MIKNLASTLFIVAGVVNGLTSIIYFIGNRILWGVVYSCLAITFIILGVFYKKKQKQSESDKNDPK